MKNIFYKIILLLLVFSGINSCKGQENKQDSGKNIKTGPYDMVGTEGSETEPKENVTEKMDSIAPLVLKKLLQLGYKQPDEKVYTEKVKEIFKFDITEYGDYSALRYESGYPEISCKKERFVFFDNIEYYFPSYEGSPNHTPIDYILIFHLNNFLFYNNSESLSYLKKIESKNIYGYNLYYLVTEYGYTGSKELLAFIFGGYIDFNELWEVEDLIFQTRLIGYDAAPYFLRYDMVDRIQEIKFNPAKDKNETKKYYNNLLEIVKKMDESPSEYPNYKKDKEFLLNRIKKYGNIETLVFKYLSQNPPK